MADLHYVSDSDVHYKIDGVLRTITNFSEIKRNLVQRDHRSERFTFEVPRYIDGHDMSKCNVVQIHYINISANAETSFADVYNVDDLNIDAEDFNIVRLSWLIDGNATQYVGTLNFMIRFACVSGKNIDYVWNTTIFEGINILPGLNNAEIVVANYSDVLLDWEARIKTLENDSINADLTQNDPSHPGYVHGRIIYKENGATNVLFYDGATVGKETHILSDTSILVKVTNDVATAPELVGAMVTRKINDSEETKVIQVGDIRDYSESNNYLIIDNDIFVILTDDFQLTVDSGTITLSRGIYFTEYLNVCIIKSLECTTKCFTGEDIYHRLPNEYLPEHLPYSEIPNVNVLEWDGSTDGKEVIESTSGSKLVKVSNDVITLKDLIGATVVWSNGTTQVLTTSDLGLNHALIYTVEQGIEAVYDDTTGYKIEGVSVTKGIYLWVKSNGVYITSITCSAKCFTGSEVVYHKLAREYLPDDIGSTPDLAQNDPTAKDYVKNRTHRKYIGEVDLVPEMSVDLKNNVDTFYVGDAGYIALELGKTYNAYLDGVKYENLAVKNLTLGDVVIYYIGNDPTDNSFSELPFSYTYRADIGASSLAYNIGTTTVTFRLTENVEIYEPFDGRYLPKGLGYIIKEGSQTATNTLTWDGDMSGKETVDISGDGSAYFVKMSDSTCTVDDLIGGTFTLTATNGESNTIEITSEDVEDASSDGIPCIMVGSQLCWIMLEDFSAEGLTFTKGIWFLNVAADGYYTSALTALTDCFVTGEPAEVKKIDNRLLDVEWLAVKKASEVEVYPTTSCTFEGSDIDIGDLTVGDIYAVYYNDVKYECEVKSIPVEGAEGAILKYFGNGQHNNQNWSDTDTGEPFVVNQITNGDESTTPHIALNGTNAETPVTLRICHYELQPDKLPEEYIPEVLEPAANAEWHATKPTFTETATIWDNVSLELIVNSSEENVVLDSFYSSNENFFEVVAGQLYSVTWNGTKYENLEAFEPVSGIICFGGISSAGEATWNPPFVFMYQSPTALIIQALGSADTTATVSVVQVEATYNKLAKEYLDLSEIQQPEVVTVSNFPELVTYTPYNAAMQALKKGLSVETEDGGRVLWAFTNNDTFASCAAVWVTRNTLNFYHAVGNKHYKALLLPTDAESGKLLRTTDGGYELVDQWVINSSTEGSNKKFRITVDDSGTISATEVTE